MLVNLHGFVRKTKPRHDQSLLLQLFKLCHDAHVGGIDVFLHGAAHGTVAVLALNLSPSPYHTRSIQPFLETEDRSRPIRPRLRNLGFQWLE